MNTVGRYNDGDERGHYTFGYYTEDGKHVNISFRAEPDYDLDIVFSEFKNFLIASGHDIEGDIGELSIDDGSYDDSDYANPMEQSWTEDNEKEMAKQYQADKFSMENFPNNGWPFGDLTTAALPRLTTADFAGLKVTDISPLYTQSHSEWIGLGNEPTMAPLTQEQIDLWKTPMPGTLGGAKIDFK